MTTAGRIVKTDDKFYAFCYIINGYIGVQSCQRCKKWVKIDPVKSEMICRCRREE